MESLEGRRVYIIVLSEVICLYTCTLRDGKKIK